VPSVTTWTRLEPRARSGDMRASLEGRVHDPLWLLAKQWQLGEFQGEDAASPVTCRLRAEVAPITAYRPGPARDFEDYDRGVPLEALVEREPVPSSAPDRRLAAEASQHLLRLLAAADVGHHRQAFRSAYPLAAPSAAEAEGLDAASRRYLAVMAGRVPDGERARTALRGPLAANALPNDLKIPAADRSKVIDAGRRWLAWFDGLVSTAPGAAAWRRERMEYAFSVGARDAGKGVVLSAPAYGEGRLDWDAFVVDSATTLPAGAAPAELTRTTLPAPVTYPGMPAPRFWQFEDARVDFGGIEAAPEDLARMLLVEFATAFSNDHYVIPVEMPVGALCHVRSLVVTDTFGRQTLVPMAGTGASDPGWTMYRLSVTGPGAAAAGGRFDRFLLPAALGPGLEGEVLEQVALARDEMANVAWAIESPTGRRIDRFEAYQERRRLEGGGDRERPGAAEEAAPLAYRLASPVPDHWFPLVPEEIRPGVNRLRLGALSRFGSETPVEPLGRLLERPAELLLPEEEVRREGAEVTRAYQYARWTDGSRHLWVGRRKRPGRGEAASGLRFDAVEPWQAPPSKPWGYEELELTAYTGPDRETLQSLEALEAGDAAYLVWRVRNTGMEAWRRSGPNPVRLGTSDPRDHPGLIQAPSWPLPIRAAELREEVVAVGGVGTFGFEIRAPDALGPLQERFDLVAEDKTWFDGALLTVRATVVRPLGYAHVELTAYTGPDRSATQDLAKLAPGQAAHVVWRVGNAGSRTWERTGANPIRLGTSDPRNRRSALEAPSWLSPSRPAQLTEGLVVPGGAGTFAFDLRAPTQAGPFEERFDLVSDGQGDSGPMEGPVDRARGEVWFDGPRVVVRGAVSTVQPPDVSPPPAPIIDAPVDNSYVRDGAFPVSGTAEAESTVQLYEGTTEVGSVKAGGDGRFSIALSGVPEGRHTYTAKATDAGGNTSAASAPTTVTVDWTPPPPPTITAPPSNSHSPERAFTVRGTAEPMSTVRLFEGPTVMGTAQTAPDGTWSIALSGVPEGRQRLRRNGHRPRREHLSAVSDPHDRRRQAAGDRHRGEARSERHGRAADRQCHRHLLRADAARKHQREHLCVGAQGDDTQGAR
jgi:hypothetical protein